MSEGLEPKSSPQTSPSNVSFHSEKFQLPPPPQPPQPRSLWDRLPPWVSTNLRRRKAWKTMIRCWVACWAIYVIMLPHRSLNALGTTAFFGILTGLFLPPYLPVQMFFIITTTLMLGILTGWGIGVAAMRAANAARSPILLAAAYQQLNATIIASPALRANPSFALTDAIFHGAFLDVRSTVVYGCFLAFTSFLFAVMRAYAPKLVFMSIFGTIAIDIFCTIGPLFPTARYTLLNSVAISIATYMAIAIVATIFIFPESMNHLVMEVMTGQLDRISVLLQLHDEAARAGPADFLPGSALLGRVRQARAAMQTTQRELMALTGLINLEFSWGKWNGDDVRAFVEPLMALVTWSGSTQLFIKIAGDASSTDEVLPGTPGHDTLLLREIQKRSTTMEQRHAVRMADILPIVDTATTSLRAACAEGIAAVRLVMNDVNTRRWHWSARIAPTDLDRLDKAVETLSLALAAFKTDDRLRLIEPYASVLAVAEEEGTNASGTVTLRSLYAALVYASDTVCLGETVLALAERTRDTAAKRRTNRLWAPTGLRKIAKVFMRRGDTPQEGAFGENMAPQESEEDQAEERTFRRDPDSKPPVNGFQRMMNSVHKLYQWTDTAEAVFIFKYVFISICFWLPSVFRTSCHFYYVEKGVWALVMAQTTLNTYAADQIYNLVIRLIGTFFGLAAGLVGWYMGNGRGNGNPYGAAASVGAVLIPIIFVRIYAPIQYLPGVVLACATFALIVGYSWIDGHTVQYATPGIGWETAWKRWTLVVIGAAASFIVMMFPAKSSRKAVRQRNATSVTTLSNIYGTLIAAWIADAPHPWTEGSRRRISGLSEELEMTHLLTELSRWEGSLRGAWPAEEYLRLLDVQAEMLFSLSQLGNVLGRLDVAWRHAFLQRTRVLNPEFIADVMSTFALTSQALRTGEPMHQVLASSLLHRLYYHSARSEVAHNVIAEEVRSMDYMIYATGLVAVFQLLQSLDELHHITRGLCGEIPLEGFASWRKEFERSHTHVAVK